MTGSASCQASISETLCSPQSLPLRENRPMALLWLLSAVVGFPTPCTSILCGVPGCFSFRFVLSVARGAGKDWCALYNPRSSQLAKQSRTLTSLCFSRPLATHILVPTPSVSRVCRESSSGRSSFQRSQGGMPAPLARTEPSSCTCLHHTLSALLRAYTHLADVRPACMCSACALHVSWVLHAMLAGRGPGCTGPAPAHRRRRP